MKDIIGSHLRQIMLKILDLIRHTENDDVSGVLQRLIYIYEEEIVTFAADMLKHLVLKKKKRKEERIKLKAISMILIKNLTFLRRTRSYNWCNGVKSKRKRASCATTRQSRA